jgi:hypothetical protein
VSSDDNPATLVASHPGNAHARKSGAFSRTGRPYPDRTAEITEAIMAAHAELDIYAANEVAALIAMIEAIDADLAKRGVMDKRGSPRKALLNLRLRASGRLATWCSAFGLTPQSRADWAKTLAEGSLAAEIARRRAQNGRDASPDGS